MNIQKQKVPTSWVWIKIKDIATVIKSGGTPKTTNSEYYDHGTIPYVKIEDMSESIKYLYSTKNKITLQGLENSAAWIVPKNSLLYSMYGSYGIPVFTNIDVATNQAILGIVLNHDLVNSNYVYYYLLYIKKYLLNETRGTTQLNLNKNIISNLDFPLPPIAEQGRIVNKIEELFSLLGSGQNAFEQIQKQLSIYRRSVLLAAFEGKLVRAFSDPPNLINSSLEQVDILQYSSLKLPIIPINWKWIKLGLVIESMKNGIYKPSQYYSNTGTPCLRMYNIENWRIVWKDIKRMILTPVEISDYQLKPQDILINRVNSRELVGKSAVINEEIESSIFESKNIRLRLKNQLANSCFVNYWFKLYSQKYFNTNAQQTVGMASINQEQIANMPFPYPSIQEQNLIVHTLQEIDNRANILEQTINNDISKITLLKQIILKKGFEGSLVPQNYKDESASILLKKIRSEQANSDALIENKNPDFKRGWLNE